MMVCYYPIKAYRGRGYSRNGKREIVFNIAKAHPALSDAPIKLPCGQCIGCRLERSRQWALRCTHEAQQHSANSFITLTYDEQNLPKDGSLNVRHFQLFVKKLRKKLGQFRYYHCGEYGDLYGRPHYHACLFGLDFPDKIIQSVNKNGDHVNTSEILTQTWGMGMCVTGDVTYQSAAYCARYIMKKINGDQSEKHYQRERFDEETGEFINYLIRPEYTTMSRNPGIGASWFKQYHSDVFPGDYVVHKGKKHRTPRYYDGQFELTNPKEFALIKTARVKKAKKHEGDNTPDRLRVRETVQEARLSRLPRNL